MRLGVDGGTHYVPTNSSVKKRTLEAWRARKGCAVSRTCPPHKGPKPKTRKKTNTASATQRFWVGPLSKPSLPFFFLPIVLSSSVVDGYLFESVMDSRWLSFWRCFYCVVVCGTLAYGCHVRTRGCKNPHVSHRCFLFRRGMSSHVFLFDAKSLRRRRNALMARGGRARTPPAF